ncbi:asparagine synthase (glutamine-hydrolyzing) [Paenibacillus sp. M1]|uniref:asparagine synthase (glutamine-hydrolyzing) n=1 Tax=Paenibacillus haidiansis TaxID=1574488 RepID=A0ABU7VPU0_9BACL
MCGIGGIFDLKRERRINTEIIKEMTSEIRHRGPDATDFYNDGNIAFGFARLGIIDLAGGMQPLSNEDGSVLMVCNGEIFNYIELRNDLILQGHHFKTNTDVEVILHLYEEKGYEFINELNGQFAFAIFDFKRMLLICSRDHFGIAPLFYTISDDYFIFGSEIKAILRHPSVEAEVDLVGLDQVLTFPGLISPRTMFRNIRSLENGHLLLVEGIEKIKDIEYWDLDYPEIGEISYDKSEDYYKEQLSGLLEESVKLRLRSDVPIGLYLSGGLDSSLIAAITHKLTPDIRRETFSITFDEKEICESKYQNMMSNFIGSNHNNKFFVYSDISTRLPEVIYQCEMPLKESYNTASHALSKLVSDKGIKAVLSGEGADEFFAGYVGHKFDRIRSQLNNHAQAGMEEQLTQDKLWGDKYFFYEKNYWDFSAVKRRLYSKQLNEHYSAIDCINHYVIDREKIINRHTIHKRSYIDYKLRLVDHLISDHGDRMTYANSIEGRYPFLDKNIAEFSTLVPPNLKLNDFTEKYILKEVAKQFLPIEIVEREKFGFVAPGSTYLLKRNIEYINDMLSYDSIKKGGYFNPDTIENLKKEYSSDGFKLNMPFDSDLLIVVLTFNIFKEKFKINNFA